MWSKFRPNFFWTVKAEACVLEIRITGAMEYLDEESYIAQNY
jgi:hypothetical protein